MKKVLKRFVLMTILILTFGLFGCGANLTTNLSISENFAGTRTMDVSISKEEIEKQIDQEEIEAFLTEIEKIKPACMNFSYEETKGGDYVLHFVMSFSSKEEYEKQIAEVLGEDCVLDFSASISPFSQGVFLDENYSSVDLLQWFKDYLLQSEYVSSKNSAYVFSSTDNFVSINGKRYESEYNDLSIKQKSYVQIKAFNIFTDIDAITGKVARKIDIVFDGYVIENNRQQVEQYLAGVTPKECQGEWSVMDDGCEKYTLVIPACTPQEMTLIMQTFCASDANSVELIIADEKIGGDDKDVSYSQAWDEAVLGEFGSANKVNSEVYIQPFGYEGTIDEKLDLSSFICNSWGEIESAYYISIKNGKPKSMVYFPDGSEAYGWDYIENKQPDYYYVESLWQPIYQVVSTVNKYYIPTATEINTVVKTEEKIEREFVFKFDESFEDEVVDRMETKMDDLFEKHKDVLSVKIKNKSDSANIIWKFKGSVDEVNTLCDEIFGMGYSDISYYCQDKFAMKQQYDYAESIDLGSIFDWQYDGNIDYTLKMPGKINENTATIMGGVNQEADISGKVVNYLSTESGYLNARVGGARTNDSILKIIYVVINLMFAISVAVLLIVTNGRKPAQKPVTKKVAKTTKKASGNQKVK